MKNNFRDLKKHIEINSSFIDLIEEDEKNDLLQRMNDDIISVFDQIEEEEFCEDLKAFSQDLLTPITKTEDSLKTPEPEKIIERVVVEKPTIVLGEKGEKGDPGATPDITSFERKFNELMQKWNSQFQMTLSQIVAKNSMHPLSGGGGGSTRILDNDDVIHVKTSLLSNNDILVFNKNQSKFQANNIDNVIAGSTTDTSYPVFIQNTAPSTNKDKYLWIQTSVNSSNNSFTFWFEDNLED